jgi:hypothetical protein
MPRRRGPGEDPAPEERLVQDPFWYDQVSPSELVAVKPPKRIADDVDGS